MKIEKINNDKVKITLSIEELALRQISPAEIKANKAKAQNFFFDLLEESKLQEDFLDDGTQLFIEASTINNLFTIIITKVLDLPSSESFSSLASKTIYRLNSITYEFKTLDNLLTFCKKVSNLNYFIGSNSLYFLKSNYYLIFSERTIKNVAFIKTFVFLSEYCDNYYSKANSLPFINEYGTCIVEKKAIQTLCFL